MAWTAPFTAIPNAALTAAQWNTYVRDNLNETAPAKATTAARIFVATGVNAIAERAILSGTIATPETFGSTSYGDCATVGPEVTLTTGTRALVWWKALVSNNTAGVEMLAAPKVTGATTIDATDTASAMVTGNSAGDRYTCSGQFLYSLTPGSHTFTLQYRVSGGGSTWMYRQIIVMAL